MHYSALIHLSMITPTLTVNYDKENKILIDSSSNTIRTIQTELATLYFIPKKWTSERIMYAFKMSSIIETNLIKGKIQ